MNYLGIDVPSDLHKSVLISTERSGSSYIKTHLPGLARIIDDWNIHAHNVTDHQLWLLSEHHKDYATCMYRFHPTIPMVKGWLDFLHYICQGAERIVIHRCTNLLRVAVSRYYLDFHAPQGEPVSAFHIDHDKLSTLYARAVENYRYFAKFIDKYMADSRVQLTNYDMLCNNTTKTMTDIAKHLGIEYCLDTLSPYSEFAKKDYSEYLC